MPVETLQEAFVSRFLEGDYSWEGLGRKLAPGWYVTAEEVLTPSPNVGSRPATLQDFWREEQGKLVETKHGAFTRWHLPPDIPASAKADSGDLHSKLEQTIRQIMTAGELECPIPFHGVGFRRTGDFAAVFGQCATIGVKLQLQDAFVEPELELRDLDVAREAVLDGICFFSDVHMHDCVFDTLFIQNAIFCGEAHFVSLSVEGECSWYRSKFGTLSCFESRFSGVTNFSRIGAQTIWFQNCEFTSGSANLSNIEAASITIKYCSARQMTLERAKFEQKAWIVQNDIQSFFAPHLRCDGEFYFGVSGRSTRVFLRDSVFGSKFHFCDPLMTDEFDVSRARFAGMADFARLQAGNARFSAAQFEAGVSFRGATFPGPADFENVGWPSGAENFVEAFRDARFLDAADFSTDSFQIVAAFNEAHFVRAPLVRVGEGKAGDASFKRMLVEAREAAARVAQGGPGPSAERAAERFLTALEGGARVLKQAMETRRSRQLEHRFYRYELLARRHRPSISRWERAISLLYGAMSNYGDSSLRPLLILLGTTLIMGAVYTAWGALLMPPGHWEMLQDGLIFSGRNVFRPFEVWSARTGTDDGAFEAALFGGGAPWPLLVRMCSTAQSFLSIILTFLTALSLKRRFQLG